jgi:hypothetical protein
VISWKAKSLGLFRKRKKKYQPWSEDADRQLISCEGFQLESVEKRMKRTKGSIWSRLLALDRGADFFGGFKDERVDETAAPGCVGRSPPETPRFALV